MVLPAFKQISLPLDFGVALSRASSLVNVLMVLAVSYAAAQLSWQLWPQPALPEPPALVAKADSSAARPQMAITPNIAALHLFGEIVVEMPKIVEAPPQTPETAPETQLRLSLNGVLMLDKHSSWAIIADAMGNEDTYKVNAPVPGGAILKEIHKDKVVLLYNGRYETLSLPKDDLNGEGGGNPALAHAGGFAPPPQNYGGAPGGFSGGAPGGPGVSGVQSLSPEATASLRNYRDALVRDPQSVMDVVRAEPFRRGGQLVGYRVFPGRDRQLMMQIGLQPGDVVTGINGVNLDSPLKGLEVMKDLSNAAQVSLSVMRNGVTQTLSVPLN